MEYIAVSKNIKTTPRKVKLVVAGIKKLSLDQAFSFLQLTSKKAALPIRKTIESAIANAVNNFKAKKEDLAIKNIYVEEGIKYKRFHYAGRGRTRPYKKRASHIKVVLQDKIIRQNSNLLTNLVEKKQRKEKEN